MKGWKGTAAAAAFAALLCAACAGGGYEKFNQMAAVEYTRVSVTVTTFFGEDSLEGRYVFTDLGGDVLLTYEIERFASVAGMAPAEEKTTFSGKAAIHDGQVIPVEGDASALPAQLPAWEFEFRKAYFAHADLTAEKFTADVKDAGSFCGIAAEDMKLALTYSEVFETILLSYTTEEGDAVTTSYVFKK